MNKPDKAKCLKLLRQKRLEIRRMEDNNNTKRKLLNIEIEMILDFLELSDEEFTDLLSEELSDEHEN